MKQAYFSSTWKYRATSANLFIDKIPKEAKQIAIMRKYFL